jgi:hypothetical protein
MDQKSGDIFSNTTRNESAIVKALSFVRAIIDKEKNRAPVRLAPYRTLATLVLFLLPLCGVLFNNYVMKRLYWPVAEKVFILVFIHQQTLNH